MLPGPYIPRVLCTQGTIFPEHFSQEAYILWVLYYRTVSFRVPSSKGYLFIGSMFSIHKVFQGPDVPMALSFDIYIPRTQGHMFSIHILKCFWKQPHGPMSLCFCPMFPQSLPGSNKRQTFSKIYIHTYIVFCDSHVWDSPA